MGAVEIGDTEVGFRVGVAVGIEEGHSDGG